MVFSFELFAKLLGACNRGRARASCRCRRRLHYKPRLIFKLELCPPMAPELLSGGSGDFGTSPFFGQLLVKTICLSVSTYLGTGTKAQWRGQKLIGVEGLRLRRPDSLFN
jgi:hypothetical protein